MSSTLRGTKDSPLGSYSGYDTPKTSKVNFAASTATMVDDINPALPIVRNIP